MPLPRRPGLFVPIFSTLALCNALLAGPPGGDLEKQRPHWKIDHIPPAPVLTPAQELATFKLPPGFRAELVAAEPLVEEPIALAFDPDGRIYVVELRGYMPDVNGTGELEPVGRITLLEDTNGDGQIDKATRFLEGLVAPRSVGLAGDGVLVAEPPNVWFCRDTDGDGKADHKESIASDYGGRSANPEHKPNGLVYMLDNYYYSANYAGRFKFTKGRFQRDATTSRGQWGIAQDDIGRLYYNSNSDMLRVDLAPASYLARNPFVSTAAGLNVKVAANAVKTARVNPGVNRGYTPVLNDQGYQVKVTAACGPTIYRGDKFPGDYTNNAFVCEPAGNIVIRHVLEPKGVTLAARSVQHDGVEFLASLDERFRPVNLYTAPDGTLYVVDLYRGILQHGAYLSAYLRDQIRQRDLDKGIHLGRIWRIVPDGVTPGPQPRLSKAPVAELVKGLSHPNGWWRDTCQRLIVQRADLSAIKLLEAIVTGDDPAATPLGRMHALWALDGLGKLEEETAALAAEDPDPRVRVAALRVGDPMLRNQSDMLWALLDRAKDADPAVQLQILLCANAVDHPGTQKALASILARQVNDPLFRLAAVSGANGREMELLELLLANSAFAAADKGVLDMLNDLSECLVRGRNADRIATLLQKIASLPADKSRQKLAMLAGVADTTAPPARGVPARKLRLREPPAGLLALLQSQDKKTLELADKAAQSMTWPGKPGDNTPPLPPLTPQQEKRFAAGREIFSSLCAQCHQPSGLGQDGVAPPLVDSEWVLGPPGRPIRIVLNGLNGPIKVGRKTYDLEMPPLTTMDDEQVASVLTYLRREWGHEATPVDPETVAAIRKESATRKQDLWTAEELQKLK